MKEKHPTREQEEKKKRNDQSPNKRPHPKNAEHIMGSTKRRNLKALE
jgi:hypothetical protein